MNGVKIGDLVPGNGDMAVVVRDGKALACVRHGEDVISMPVKAEIGLLGSLRLPVRLGIVAGWDDKDWWAAKRGTADEIAEAADDA